MRSPSQDLGWPEWEYGLVRRCVPAPAVQYIAVIADWCSVVQGWWGWALQPRPQGPGRPRRSVLSSRWSLVLVTRFCWLRTLIQLILAINLLICDEINGLKYASTHLLTLKLLFVVEGCGIGLILRINHWKRWNKQIQTDWPQNDHGPIFFFITTKKIGSFLAGDQQEKCSLRPGLALQVSLKYVLFSFSF